LVGWLVGWLAGWLVGWSFSISACFFGGLFGITDIDHSHTKNTLHVSDLQS